jgi:flagellum-specific ATP synthase
MLGRVFDGLGNPMDGGPAIEAEMHYPVTANPPNAMTRRMIEKPLATGVRAIDGMLTLGEGQRMGIFAGSGVGKSTLLGMIARNCEAEINIICLVGERGREVREFMENDLGEEGLKRSIIVCATGEQPALVRIKAALTATALAEGFRDQGKSVLLMMDSVTRFAMAQREVGLAIGEPPSTKGYTPSVFALLPRLMERAGMGPKGAITALYTVLVDGDDTNEPIADATRGILDGHIVLNRKLTSRGHYPPIDILNSLSRTMPFVVCPEQIQAATDVRELMAAYNDVETSTSNGHDGVLARRRRQLLAAGGVEGFDEHAAGVAGIDHVGLGSDFDGVTKLPVGMEDVSKYPVITELLLRRGYDEESIHKVLYGNALRVLHEVTE